MLPPRIYDLLASCTTDTPFFPPTLLYNEGWLVRLIVDWFAQHPLQHHPLSFLSKTRWFSEALIPSAFLPRYRGDKLAESRTHVDAAIGHFCVGSKGKADLELLPNATHFVVLEAKMASGLSSNVRNANYFDQAARNVACIAEVLRRANRSPAVFSALGFYVLAPQSQIVQGVFAQDMQRDAIQQKVERRVREYEGVQNEWYSRWFSPTFKHMNIDVLSWESILGTIQQHDPTSGSGLTDFYKRCVTFN